LPEPKIKSKATMTFRTEERDKIHKLIEKYGCSPFNGKCHVEDVTFYRDKKTGLYNIILTEEHIKKFKIKDDFVAPNGATQIMLMIKPTEEDDNYIIFRKKYDE
jgi:hypothetical protein